MLTLVKALSVGLGSALLVILVMWIVLSDFTPYETAAPTDQTLEANFRTHKQKLESLVEMSNADVSKEQNQRFRDLLREAGIKGDIWQQKRPDSSTTFLPCWSGGLMINGLMKGYAYSETEPTPVVLSLDDTASWPKGSKVFFKKLEDHWYLFLMGT